MSYGHEVPTQAAAKTDETLRATTGLRGIPTDAERARTLLAKVTFAALASQSVECPGFPFGSLVAHTADPAGRILLCLSKLAEHSRNLAADPRASVMVTEAGEDPLSLGRVTLIGTMQMLAGAEAEAAAAAYLAAHPNAFWASFADFSMYRLEVSGVRYVGGFGRMSWVAAGEYAAAEPDPLLGAAAERVIEHMNDDHTDALIAYSRAFGQLDTVTAARLVGVDRYGMDVMAESDGAQHAVRVPFPERSDTVDAVRAATIALLRTYRSVS
ncbi:MAG: HugZ family pyridoxamine 5'-phosphate oxidase [Sporichthyaceae bacterium]